jgi:hypothetical protein
VAGSPGGAQVGKLISDAMARVGRQGVVTMEESKTAEDNLIFVEGMQFERGFYRWGWCVCGGGCGGGGGEGGGILQQQGLEAVAQTSARLPSLHQSAGFH